MRQWLSRNFTLIFILILALILRLPLLNGSFWLDEAAQTLEADRQFSQQLQIEDDFQPPLLHLITFFAIQFNQSEAWLRFCGALIPGLLTIWGTYLLGQKLVSKKVGLLAALFLATSSFHIYFSQELRPYSLSAVFVIWSWFFLLESQKVGQDMYQLKPKNILNKFFALFPVSRDFFLFLLTSILGLYSSYLYPFVLLSQIIFLWREKKISQTLYAIAIPSIAFLPWLPSFLGQLQAGQALRASFPGWENVVSFSLWRAPTLTFGKFLFGVINLDINFSFIAITLIFCALSLIILFSQRRQFWRQHRQKLSLWFYFLILPFLLASLISIFVPVIQPKRVIYLLPFLYLLLSFLILGTRDQWSKLNFTNWSLLILILAINLFSTFTYYTEPNLQRENWRHALNTLHQDYQTTDTLAVFTYEEPFSPWRWYEQKNNDQFPTLSTGNYDTSQLENLNIVLSPIGNYQNIIVFDYLRSLTDQENLLPKYLTNLGYTETRIYDYPNLGFIRIYSRLNPESILK
ncbi:MAG: hypothetical protein Q4G02_02160 [bacterium]|nr:hypothetical protein [bacterium]